MLATIAKCLNDGGNSAQELGWERFACFLYRSATIIVPTWSSAWYNLGLRAKYREDWVASLKYNQRAVFHSPSDQAGWWNLGIAATALQDWREAKRAWEKCGIEVEERDGELEMGPSTSCVRINPTGQAEVVWGTRIDPARIRIDNVPLPQSKHRYRDILLNDGAPEGYRRSGEHEYPVFNELAMWRPSQYSTFCVTIQTDSEKTRAALVDRCVERDIGVEDWGTVRSLCAACSRGNPGEHVCTAVESTEKREFGFGAHSRETLVEVLVDWASFEDDASFSEPRLEVTAGV